MMERRSQSTIKPLIFLALELIALGLISYVVSVVLGSDAVGFIVFILAACFSEVLVRTKKFRSRARYCGIYAKYSK